MANFLKSGMQIAFYSGSIHFFFFYVSLMIESLLMNIYVKLIQIYNLSNICVPVLSPLGVNVGRCKHWILLLLSESSQE